MRKQEQSKTMAQKMANHKGRYILNPRTGRPFVYLSHQQAKNASTKRGGQVVRMSAGGSYALILFQE